MTNKQKQLFIDLNNELNINESEHNVYIRNSLITALEAMTTQHRDEIAQLLADSIKEEVPDDE